MTKRVYLLDRYDALKAKRLCVTCGTQPAKTGLNKPGVRCEDCRSTHARQQASYRTVASLGAGGGQP